METKSTFLASKALVSSTSLQAGPDGDGQGLPNDHKRDNIDFDKPIIWWMSEQLLIGNREPRMTKRLKSICGILALALSTMAIANFASAGIAVAPVYGSQNETLFSLGIQFDFGDRQTQVVAGARRTHTDSNNEVTGAKLDIAFPIVPFVPAEPTIRLMGLAGTPDFQGELGVGIDLGSNSPLVGAGVQAPFTNGGLNYVFGEGLEPYLGLNTIMDAPDAKIIAPVGCM